MCVCAWAHMCTCWGMVMRGVIGWESPKSTHWPQKCPDVKSLLKRSLYTSRVGMGSSCSSGLENIGGATMRWLAASSYTSLWGSTWGQRPGESLALWEEILSLIAAHCPLWNFGTFWTGGFLFLSILTLSFLVACKEQFLLYVPYILPCTSNILHFNIFSRQSRF